MKLIVCLIVLSLIFVFWSSALTDSTVRRIPKDYPALEQFHGHQAFWPSWWSWEIWSEWLTPPRCRKSWRKLRLSLYKIRSWYHRRVRRKAQFALRAIRRHCQRARRWLLRPWQEWRDSVNEASSVRPPAEDIRQEMDPQRVVPIPSRETSSTTAMQEVEEPKQPKKRGRGRPRTIPTDHRCCLNEECSSYGIIGPHPDHDIVGVGTYTTKHGEVRQMYQCNPCGKPFSETAGTPFHRLKTPKGNVVRTFKELSEGMGIRGAARAAGVDKDTVLSWLEKAGQHCQRVSEHVMQELELAQVQLDELWTFVRKKQRRLSEQEKEYTEWGDAWIWIAFDPIHKLVPAMLIGKRMEEEAKGLLRQLRDRLVEGALPFFTSDSLAHYVEAILHIFGKWVQPKRRGDRGRFPKPRPVAQEGLEYATVRKEREKGHIVSVTTKVIYGAEEAIRARLKALGQTINTSYVERENLTLRHLTSRLHRKTLCFSKEREYLEYHLHLVLAYYHFVLYHSSLRERLPEPIPTRGDGSPKIWRQQTPAMSAGLTDHQWTMEELLMFQVPAGP